MAEKYHYFFGLLAGHQCRLYSGRDISNSCDWLHFDSFGLLHHLLSPCIHEFQSWRLHCWKRLQFWIKSDSTWWKRDPRRNKIGHIFRSWCLARGTYDSRERRKRDEGNLPQQMVKNIIRISIRLWLHHAGHRTNILLRLKINMISLPFFDNIFKSR